jgi:hypothetical protein
MSKIWKWILGIAIALVVVGALCFVAWNTFGSMRWSGHMSAYERGYPPMMEEFERGGKNFPGNDFDHGRMPMMDGYSRFHSPMMGGYGFMPLPFLVFGGLVRLVFPLGVLALVAYFAYKKGKKDGALELQAAGAAETATPPKRGRKVA